MATSTAVSDPCPNPCNKCLIEWRCSFKGLVCREAIFNWLEQKPVPACPEFTPDYFRGIEGVYR